MADRMQHHKMEVHPDYPELRVFVASVPLRFEQGEGEVIYSGRNELRCLHYQGRSYVVKSFHKPNLINRLVYGHFRPSKAERAFRNGLELLQAGVPNPLPIGYIEVRAGWLFDKSFLITERSECPYTWNDLFYQDIPYREQVVRAVGRFTAHMHQQGLALKDYSRGNILFRLEGDEVKLEVVDLNRMYHGELDLQAACHNMERLPATPQMHRWMAEEYAPMRDFDVEECYRLLQQYRSTQPGKIDDKY